MMHIRLNNAEIGSLVAGGPSYYAPLLKSVRDLNLGLYFVQQNCWPFDLPIQNRPVVTLIGDDTEKAIGPNGFHRKSLRRLVRWADNAVMVACAPAPALYACASIMATCLRFKTLIIETRLEQEQAWIDWVTAANPEIRLLIGTGMGGQA